jgi:hypothetical protein
VAVPASASSRRNSGWTPVRCDRFERLQVLGCFTLVAVVEASALGLESETFISIRAEPRQLSTISHALVEHDEVRYLALTLGASTLICEIILTDTPAELPGVLGWDAFLETLTLKRSSVETLWWPAETRFGRSSAPGGSSAGE